MYYVVSQDPIKENISKDMMIPHVEYIHKLFYKGVLVVSGPFSDERGGGMFILEANNLHEVVELADNDPAVKDGVLKNNIRLYKLSFLRK